jgi:hypothetical protein
MDLNNYVHLLEKNYNLHFFKTHVKFTNTMKQPPFHQQEA